jgi:class 3 adenylate cyclase
VHVKRKAPIGLIIMALADDLKNDVATIFRHAWTEREAYFIPTVDSLGLGNDAVILKGTTVLYADMADSTYLVNNYKPAFVAEVFKAFLIACVRIIKNNHGQITAYDGDRVMAVFDSTEHYTDAAKCGLQIKYAVREIVNPAIKAQYPSTPFVLKHAVGIDTSNLYVARVGIRNNNDLIWIGRAANYAAKLSAFREEPFTTWITKSVYDSLKDDAKFSKGVNMWKHYSWTSQNNTPIYGSSYQWSI